MFILCPECYTINNTLICSTCGFPLDKSKRGSLNDNFFFDCIELINIGQSETAKKYGDDQVLIWRRSYDISPNPLDPSDPRTSFNDPRYAMLKREEIPLTECLKDTVTRVMPFWNDSIAPAIRSGKRILISAHGNSLRALIKYLDGISEKNIVGLNIPNGQPLVYELDADLKPIRSYYLGDPAAIEAALTAVASLGKTK